MYAPPEWNLTDVLDVVEALLTPVSAAQMPAGPMLFVHNNCNGPRGELAKELVQLGVEMTRPSLCLNNAHWPGTPFEQWYYNDCEANRNARKTERSADFKITAALENTFAPDYFTEKRYQV